MGPIEGSMHCLRSHWVFLRSLVGAGFGPAFPARTAGTVQFEAESWEGNSVLPVVLTFWCTFFMTSFFTGLTLPRKNPNAQKYPLNIPRPGIKPGQSHGVLQLQTFPGHAGFMEVMQAS